jgi:hypothetical protein
MRCVVCEKHLAGHFSLCRECEDKWGHSAKERPAWLNYLISQNVIETNSERETSGEFSLDYMEYIMTRYPDQKLTGLFREIYGDQDRPTEEDAIENMEKRSVINRLIKWAGGMVKDD